MTYGLVASAAAAAGDDTTADMAADWLIDDMDSGGWGTAWTWDPFGDGSTTPADTPYSVTTAIAIQGLLDRGVRPDPGAAPGGSDAALGPRWLEQRVLLVLDGPAGRRVHAKRERDDGERHGSPRRGASPTSFPPTASVPDRSSPSVDGVGVWEQAMPATCDGSYSDRHDIVDYLNYHGYHPLGNGDGA